MLSDKTVVLGVTGSIAAYKAVALASQLTQEGATVEVVMTRGAREFVTPLTFETITHRPVVTEMFAVDAQSRVQHVTLGQRADLIVIAPATATTIARLASGLADEVLVCVVLSTTAPIIVAPAMEGHMYENAATQENLRRLRERGFILIEPEYGRLASGARGQGRLVDNTVIVDTIRQVLGRQGDMGGKRVVVTAGGTQEPVDPVRFLSNRSSGKMGYALAEAARDRGAEVVLIAAPTALNPPGGVRIVNIRTAAEMRDAVLREITGSHALLMAAAVSDYRPGSLAPQKLKKAGRVLSLELVETPDILAEAAAHRASGGTPLLIVGFAAESENLVANARAKLLGKGIDLIVANDITSPDSGFGSDYNRVVLIDREREVTCPRLTKKEVAVKILERMMELRPLS